MGFKNLQYFNLALLAKIGLADSYKPSLPGSPYPKGKVFPLR